LCFDVLFKTLIDLFSSRVFLTKVDTGFVNMKCYNKGIERGFDSIKTCIALEQLVQFVRTRVALIEVQIHD